MKTKDLIELLERNGWKFKRHGANHDIYVKEIMKSAWTIFRNTRAAGTAFSPTKS